MQPNRLFFGRSDEVLTTMLTREPPDGKEKPEPPKHQKHETLSRKNSKCDLLDARCSTSGGESASADSGSVASGGSGQLTGLTQLTLPTTPKADSVTYKRNSISALGKDTVFIDSQNINANPDSVDGIKDW